MELPGRLRSTTLGDLLGTLHRAAVTGALELSEDSGRMHRVHFSRGLVSAVELDGASPSLAEILRTEAVVKEDVLRRSLLRAMGSSRLHGEVLVHDFQLSPDIVGAALRRQVLERLAALDRLSDARLSFRVAVRVPPHALGHRSSPVGPQAFLHGRRRHRDRASSHAAAAPASGPWQVLGLQPGADVAEIKRAYRALAKRIHPDLHPEASADERDRLELRFARLTEAYRALVA
jgi:hypothetical protein